MTQNKAKPKIMVENISCILPKQNHLGGLFVGNVYGAQNPTILKQYGIRAVLTSSIQTDINYSFKDIPFYMKIQAHDKQNYNIRQHINNCIDFIQNARQFTNVYVHCFAGVSRSVAIICAYIMWKLKWNYQTTIAFVKAKRIVAKPNQGFVKQLLQIQPVLLQTSSYISSQSSKLQQNTQLNNNNINNTKISNNHNIAPTLPPQYQFTQQINQNFTAKQQLKETILQNKIPTSINKQYYVQSTPYPYPAQMYPKQTNLNYTKPLSSNTQQVDKEVYSAQQFYTQNPNKNAYTTNQQQSTYKNQSNPLKNQKNDRFFYLQNFFPQNHANNKNTHQDFKSPQNTQKVNQQHQNQKLNYHDSNTSSGQSWMTHSKHTTKLNTSLKKKQSIQNHQNSAKNLTNFQPQNHVSSNSQLILGGRKNSYNHNNIPIPKVTQRKQNPKIHQNMSRTSETVPFSNDFYKIQNEANYTHRTSQGLAPQINQYMWNQSKNIQTQPKSFYQNIQSPSNENIYNKKFDFRSSAPSQGFYNSNNTNRNSNSKKQAQKSTSRLLIRPKDLPGYKNY